MLQKEPKVIEASGPAKTTPAKLRPPKLQGARVHDLQSRLGHNCCQSILMAGVIAVQLENLFIIHCLLHDLNVPSQSALDRTIA